MNKIYKITVLSDSHMHLCQSAIDSIKGKFDNNSVYECKNFGSYHEANKLISAKKHEKPDLIVHAGDIGSQDIIDKLESISNVVAVNGNCDFCSYKTLNGFTQNFCYHIFNNIGIALTHTPNDLERFVNGSFLHKSKINDKSKLKLLIHGHTHFPEIKTLNDGMICICPGSVSMGRYGSCKSISNIYTTDNDVLHVEMLEV